MDFSQLAVVVVVGAAGPLLAWRSSWHLPVVLGELAAGLVLGRTGAGYLDPTDPTFSFLADIGFALVMFVAGSHVPVRDRTMRRSLRGGVGRAAVVGVAAVVMGWALSRLVGVPHPALYAVLIASSSAALVLPVIDSLGLRGPAVLGLLPQIAVADTAAIVVLPLAIDPAHAGRAAVGALVVIAAAALVWWVLLVLERRGLRKRVHDVSEDRGFALELRVQLAILFALSALAINRHVSIMLAGFVFGLAVSQLGEPRRLARQLFAVTEGFLGPVFFVWLGAELQLGDLVGEPSMIWLGVGLGVGATLCHLVPRLWGQPVPIGLLATAQLGVPVAAATIGSRLGVLRPGEASALMLGAVLTILAAVMGGTLAARGGRVSDVSGAG